MKKIDKIIKESLAYILNERVANSSVDWKYIKDRLESYGFTIYHADQYGIRAYILDKSIEEERNAFNKAYELINRGGWSCQSAGNYYDGLRDETFSIASAIAKEYDCDPEKLKYAITCLNIEPEFGEYMDADNVCLDDIDMEEYLDPNSYRKDERCGVELQKDIFWHRTLRKYVPRIMRQGLVPKNGHTITRWRDTNDRIYLSLLPEFDEVEGQADIEEFRKCFDTSKGFTYKDFQNPKFLKMYTKNIKPQMKKYYSSGEEYMDTDDMGYGEEMVMLKINIAPIRDKIKFYRDDEYSNAVYTYTSIPPQCITVIDSDMVNHTYFLKKDIKDRMDAVIQYNLKKAPISEYNLLVHFGDQIADIIIKTTKYGNIPDMVNKGKENELRDIIDKMVEERIEKLR